MVGGWCDHRASQEELRSGCRGLVAGHHKAGPELWPAHRCGLLLSVARAHKGVAGANNLWRCSWLGLVSRRESISPPKGERGAGAFGRE